MAFANDDYLNVVADHIQTALQADTKFAALGALAITTWELETRENAAEFGDNQLPAVSTECYGLVEMEETSIPEGSALFFGFNVWFTISAATRQKRRQLCKQYTARGVRVLEQQEDPAKQLANLPAALAWAEPGSVVVIINSADVAEGQLEGSNLFRAIGNIDGIVKVDFTITGD